MTGTSLGPWERPSHMIAPLPNEAWIWSMASWSAESFLERVSSPDSTPSDFAFFFPVDNQFLFYYFGQYKEAIMRGGKPANIK